MASPQSPARCWLGSSRVRRDAGPEPKRFHDLRHTAATLMLTMAVALETIQETLAHASFRTTRDIYARVLPSMQREAADKMGTFLRGEVSRGPWLHRSLHPVLADPSAAGCEDRSRFGSCPSRPRSQVVRQRSAKPPSRVRFPPWPPVIPSSQPAAIGYRRTHSESFLWRQREPVEGTPARPAG